MESPRLFPFIPSDNGGNMGSTFNASMYPGSSPVTSQERGAIHTSIASKVVTNGTVRPKIESVNV